MRTISGYIVYAGECRKGIQNENPDFNFGEISKAVGTKVCTMIELLCIHRLIAHSQLMHIHVCRAFLCSDAHSLCSCIFSISPIPGTHAFTDFMHIHRLIFLRIMHIQHGSCLFIIVVVSRQASMFLGLVLFMCVNVILNIQQALHIDAGIY